MKIYERTRLNTWTTVVPGDTIQIRYRKENGPEMTFTQAITESATYHEAALIDGDDGQTYLILIGDGAKALLMVPR